MPKLPIDRAGRRRSPATPPGFHAGHAPGNKGLRYPADPPKVEEIIAVMRTAGHRAHGRRLRALIVIMWRAGRRIPEALALAEAISISVAARCWCGAARAVTGARSAWMRGDGTTPVLARGTARAAGRSLALRDQRDHARSALVAGRGTRRAAAHGGRGRSSTS